MNYIGRVAQGVKDFYYELNSSTLTGFIIIISTLIGILYESSNIILKINL